MSLALIPSKEEYSILESIAKTAADSKHFNSMGGFPAILCIALYAKEMGIPVLTALYGGMVSIQGKITMSADMMNNLIRQAGHKVEILECSTKRCIIKGTRRDTGESYTVEFSMEDANRAKLVKPNSGWEKHPDDMLFARCISKLRRRLFPDVAARSYTHGEIEDEKKEPSNSEQILEVSVETGEIKKTAEAAKEEIKVYLNTSQMMTLESVIGDDDDYKKKIYNHFKITCFDDLEERFYETVLRKAKKHSELRLQEEMAKSGEEKVSSENDALSVFSKI